MTTPRFEGDEELERVLADLTEPAMFPVCRVCLQIEGADRGERTGPGPLDFEAMPVHPTEHDFEPLTPSYELGQIAESGGERALWRFGRALQAMAERDREYERYMRMVREEVERERAKLRRRMTALDELIGEAARRRREELGAKSLHIPGVGTWTTRTVPPSWRTEDEQAAIASLRETPDEFVLFTHEELVTRLLKDDLKGWLTESGFEAFPGMTRTEEHIAVKGPVLS